jgi:Domain of unknown function (DUF4394)
MAVLKFRLFVVVSAAALLTACASTSEPAGEPRPETVYAVTDAAELIRFNAGRPQHIEQRLPLQGLRPGDRLVGIDFRVARGVLFALSASGRLYTVDTSTARLSAVGSGAPVALQGQRFGVDFNPVADRVRVASDSGQNLRLHPDTGALAATDPAVQLPATRTGAAPVVVAGAAYTYNKRDDKLTTNYAIDIANGWLLTQGSREGVQPVVSPNTGVLAVVGELGTGALEDAAFDIADTNNAALAALRSGGRTRLFALDLDTGRARLLGTVGDGRALWGLAIAP